MEKQRCYGCMQLKSGNPICEHCGYDARTGNLPHQLKPGTVLQDQYVVGRALGQGGFGITYMGWDRFLDIPVAIKEFFPNGVVVRDTTVTDIVSLLQEDTKELYANNRERFIREATSLARLGRNTEVSHIVRVQNLVQANSTAYIIMEYVDGTDLRGYVRKKGGVLAIGQTLEMLLPLMEDLGKVHESHIVHRDISPDNIMVLPNGTTKLIDFGAAHEVSLDTNGIERSTEAILKYGFAPIEQYQRRGGLGSWTDVYALCATIYYCVSGKVPPHATDRLIGDEDFEWDTIPGMNPKLLSVLKKGTAIRKEDRIQTMRELQRALTQSMQGKAEEPVADRGEPYTAPLRYDDIQTAPAGFPGANATVPVDFKLPEEQKQRGKNRLVSILAVIAAVAAAGILLWKPREEPVVPEVNVPDTTVETTTEPTEETHPRWPGNELMAISEMPETYADAVPIFGSDLMSDEIATVTFLDTLADAPANSRDWSRWQDGSVKVWTKPNGVLYDLYIGAEGGINAKAACAGMFYSFTNLQKINFNNSLHTEYVTDMSQMFYGCSSLTELDLSGLDTSNVTNMYGMFWYCRNLAQLDVSSLDTGNVTNMYSMFDSCWELKKLDLSGFNTANVTDMGGMFYHCASLTHLDVSSFDTGNVTNMFRMFEGCNSLLEVDVSGFNTEKVTDMGSMFSECWYLKELDVSGFDTRNCTWMAYMFYECNYLSQLDVSGFDTSKVTGMSKMFYGTQNMKDVSMPNINTKLVETASDVMDPNDTINGKGWKSYFKASQINFA